MSYPRVNRPLAPTYRPPQYSMQAEQVLAILLEQGVSEREALGRVRAQFPPPSPNELDIDPRPAS